MAEHRFHTPDPIELEVTIPAGEIEVVTVDGDESVVSLEGSDRLLEKTTVELRAGKLVVEYHGKDGLGTLFSWGSYKLRVHATVPHGVSANLANAAADMDLRGQFASLDTKTVSGDLVVNGNVGGDADLKTVSGDIRLQNVDGDLAAKTVSGDISATSVGGSINVNAVSGDVRVGSVRQGLVAAYSVSGDIEIGIAPGTNVDVDASSLSGDLASGVPLGSTPTGNGDGQTLVVRSRTVSGDFKIFRAA